MCPEPKKVRELSPQEGLGSLSGCLVEGDAEQQSRERSVRRRALVISVVLESAVLAALILMPLFGKTQHIALAYTTPAPPYSRYPNSWRDSGPPPRDPTRPHRDYHFDRPTNISPRIPTRDPRWSGEGTNEAPIESAGIGGPDGGVGLIVIGDPNGRVPPAVETHHQSELPPRLRMTQLDPAMLIHRVEPVYPALGKQMHRDGHVELRAIIGTDGTIQYLQIVLSDPLFNQSAVEAVRQWRYRPTVLNGQPVEIETHITVVYSTQH